MSVDIRFERLVLASRANAFASSPWTDAELVSEPHPDPIYLSHGAPSAEVEPVERLRVGADRAWGEAGGNLDYGEIAGYLPLREIILDRLQARGIQVGVDDLLVTSGSQQGIDLIAKLMLDPGDGVIVEGPTYIGAMQVFDAYEANYFVCPVDADGLCVDTLERLIADPENRIKLIYTIPTFHNPTGANLASSRRNRLLEMASRYGVLVVEDDPYGEIYFGNPPSPALRSLDETVIYLGTFSKIIAPGIRVGWMVAPPSLIPLLLLAKEGVDINCNRIMTRTVYHASCDFLDEHIVELRSFYEQRRNAMVQALTQSAPQDVTIMSVTGGFFAWCDLPEGSDTEKLRKIAARHGVGFLPGAWFYPEGQRASRGLRLSFSSLPVDRIVEGANRLGHAMSEYLSESR
jgi:2-aminoadipate transaminase